MGANTFPLKEYYVFAFSTGIDLRGNTNPTNSNPWIPLLLLDE
jgi:hypothetical protein